MLSEGAVSQRRRQRINAPRKEQVADSLGSTHTQAADTLVTDSVAKPEKQAIEVPITYEANDSVAFMTNAGELYGEAKVVYQQPTPIELTAEVISMDMENNTVHAWGVSDSLGTVTGKPVFKEGETPYETDTIRYNFNSKRGLISNVVTQQGEGYVVSEEAKKGANDEIYMRSGKYTTCDDHDHPHFYLKLSMAKVRPKKNAVFGPAQLVVEDVPLPIAIPFGFFPFNSSYSSGFIMPTFGDEMNRGFYLRDGGYYFAISDNMDLKVLGEIFTKGSWGLSAQSNYAKRYKYSGSFNASYLVTKTGEKNMPDYMVTKDFKIAWSHRQDPKAIPNSTFSANVNFATSSYDRRNLSSLYNPQQYANNTKASSVSYSRTFPSIGLNLSSTFNITQNTRDSSLSVTLPDLNLSLNRIYPFKRKKSAGEERWYEKISFQYTGRMTNSITTKDDLIMKQGLSHWKNGMQHTIPVSATFTLFKYFNVVPSFNYTERWYFKKVSQQWNEETHKVETLEPEYGFWRLYNYNASVSANTTIYGTYTAKKKHRKLQAVRHTLTPNIGLSYAPDFSRQMYGFYETVQTDTTGRFKVYSPFTDNAYGVPGSGQQFSINFGLSQSLEAKVRTKDTVKKVKIIDQLSITGSYNFLADSMRLSSLPIQLRTTVYQNIALNLSLTLDPYEVSPQGVRYNKLMWRRGLPGRIQSASWSFGYTFKSREDKSKVAGNDITSLPAEYFNSWSDPYGQLNPAMRRQWMAGQYYDFSIPWNFGFNYSFSYNARYVNNGTTGYTKNIQQTINFNASVKLTPKTMITATSGYDFTSRKMSMTSISITRDLHCWQMSFTWIPFGNHRSWAFNIGVKAASLADLKYDKSYSQYDYMY